MPTVALAQWSDCLKSQGESGVVVEKTWIEPTWKTQGVKNAFAFPTFPQRCDGGLASSKRNLLGSEQMTYLSGFGVQPDQQFMSQGDTSHFLCFAGFEQAITELRKIRV